MCSHNTCFEHLNAAQEFIAIQVLTVEASGERERRKAPSAQDVQSLGESSRMTLVG